MENANVELSLRNSLYNTISNISLSFFGGGLHRSDKSG